MRVEDVMQRDGQFDHAKPRAEMAAGNRDRGDQLLPQLFCQLRQFVILEGAEILWCADAVKQRRGTDGAHSLLPGAVRKKGRKDQRVKPTFIGREAGLQLSRKAGQIVS